MACSTKSQYEISKNLTSLKKIPDSNMFDLKSLLELLHVNNEVNVQVKLFATLSAYIMTNEASRDLIITYNSLYDKICSILTNCSPGRATVTFNFLSVLLYTGDEDNSRRKSLIVYAKNMIRTSGCLATMCDLFTSCMMHQDVWRSLCRCLAETCCGVEANQSYCTHLVPMVNSLECIQRCNPRNIEAFSVLQSLLQNHTRNINLFIECNGISLFQREFLQHDDCLQLLNILVQSSAEAIKLIKESDVSYNLRDFLRMYGPETQLGQWATIILYYISGDKEPPNLSNDNKAIDDEPILKTINNCIGGDDNMECTTNTTKLLQNVMNEIIHCGIPGDQKYLQGLLPAEPVNIKNKDETMPQFIFQNNGQKAKQNALKQNESLSYRFLRRHNDNNTMTNELYENIQNNITKNSSFALLQNINHKRNSDVASNCNVEYNKTECLRNTMYTNRLHSMMSIDRNEHNMHTRQNTLEMYSFSPKIVSTPKKDYITENSEQNMEFSQTITRRSIQNSIIKSKPRRRYVKKRIPRRQPRSKVQKDNKQRSISGWFFETINESCTTLVKTVKNIFKPSRAAVSIQETDTKSLSSISNNNSPTCSFSFTNYMRKRDAILKNECTKKYRAGSHDITVEMSNRCHTCNDTIALKSKLANDEYLKQTVRKLKLGINLYGCDFKKISKQLWPQQTYMTPAVLYNLYRKLIIK